MLIRKILPALVIAAFLLTAPAFAQEGGSPEKAAQTANSGAEKPGMLVWQWINFVILVGALGWLIKKHGSPYFTGRAKGIAEGLAAGEKAKKEAEERAKAVDARLANLKNEIEDLRSKAHAEREREAERIRRDTAAEIARLHTHAEQELEAAGKQARLDVQRFAAVLAIELAEKKIRAGMSGEAQAAMVDRFVRNLPEGKGAEGQGARPRELVTR